ncbi:putative choline transporter, neither null mutation nor overexpression affects choline transport [Entophlyctis luteolus]|nr:putative choline transporter, neither null mutation nor overexpression affects choline transport [Entophlyctis luteolus]
MGSGAALCAVRLNALVMCVDQGATKVAVFANSINPTTMRFVSALAYASASLIPAPLHQQSQEYLYQQQPPPQLVYPAAGGKVYAPVPPPNPPQFIERRRFNDFWATLLFAAFVGAFIVLAVFSVPYVITSLRTGQFDFPGTGSTASTSTATTGISASEIGALLGASVGVGLAFSLGYFFLMLNFPAALIKFSYFLNVCLLLGLAAYFLYLRIWVAGVIYAVFGILVGLSYYWLRHRIPFSALVLETVCKITFKFSGTLWVAFGGVLVAACFSVLWLTTAVGFLELATAKNLSDVLLIVVIVLSLFVSFWFNEVVRNTVHTTVCGTFASYYFLGIQQPNSTEVTLPTRNVTAKSLGRAITTSFGSICFGSLLVSIIRTLRYLAQVAQNDAAQDGNFLCCVVACCMNCILSCLADILDFFNKYAYTEIAIYGKPYCDAGRDTWNLIKYKGIDLIINDSMIGNVLGMGSLFAALLCAFAGYLYVDLNHGLGTLGSGVGVYVVVCLVSAFIGGWLFLVLLEVVESGTSATFVCLAEDPATIQRQLPTLFREAQDRFPQVTWGMQSNAY